MSAPADTPDAHARARALLADHRTMTLTSSSAQGPWAATVFYAEQFDAHARPSLVFVSSPSSRHVAELDTDPRAAATVHGDVADWRAIRGLQIAGQVIPLDGEALRVARETYAAKFPQIGDPARAPEPIARAFARVRWFALRVERIFLTDNTVAFGQREELRYPPAQDD